MIVIRTAEEMAPALDSSLPPDLKGILQAHMSRLAEWLNDVDLQQLAVFVVVRAGDSLASIEAALGRRLVEGGAATFTLPPEYVKQHGPWIEAVTILSDFGDGLVLLIEVAEGTDARLLAACNRHLELPAS